MLAGRHLTRGKWATQETVIESATPADTGTKVTTPAGDLMAAQRVSSRSAVRRPAGIFRRTAGRLSPQQSAVGSGIFRSAALSFVDVALRRRLLMSVALGHTIFVISPL